jgi:hypothetical protein
MKAEDVATLDLEMANCAEAERRYGDAGTADDIERWRKSIRALIAERDRLRAALEAMVAEKVDYMIRNALGDPEAQHTIKQARAALERKP